MMKRIPLTQGQFAIVDKKDFGWLNQWKWHCRKVERVEYAVRSIGKWGRQKALPMQHVILSCPSGFEIDHINHNGLDNRRSNLRLCTHAQNMFNRRSNQGERRTSQFKGVSLSSRYRWRARIHVNDEVLELGYFDDECDAAIAYNKAAKEHFGTFAHLNSL